MGSGGGVTRQGLTGDTDSGLGSINEAEFAQDVVACVCVRRDCRSSIPLHNFGLVGQQLRLPPGWSAGWVPAMLLPQNATSPMPLTPLVVCISSLLQSILGTDPLFPVGVGHAHVYALIELYRLRIQT